MLAIGPSGPQVLTLERNVLVRRAFAAHGTRIDCWVVNGVTNSLLPAGDLTGDDKRNPRLRDIYTRTRGLARDLFEDQAIETGFREMAKTNELDEGGEGIPALLYLEGWATNDEAEQRILAFVGGFGMGKTFTVQRLADRAFQREAGSTPVYLECRRLIPISERGKPIASTSLRSSTARFIRSRRGASLRQGSPT